MLKKLIILLFIFNPLMGEQLSGIPKIVDGDTVHINEYKIRLEGIDAPELNQSCKKPYLQISSFFGLSLNKNYECGKISKKKLIIKINNQPIKCISSSKDKYKRYLGTCYLGKLNLNKWMVREGYAVAYRRYSKRYLIDEKYAFENKLGLWEGTFLRPEKWRKLN